MRFTAIIDGTIGSAVEQARALAGFLEEGLHAGAPGGPPGRPWSGLECETLAFYADDREREQLIALAPTIAVRLVRAPERRPDLLAATLAATAGEDGPDLFLFTSGQAGTEVAARLARRAGGSVLTGALDISLEPDRLLGRRQVYSNHMVGRFALTARPWCVAVDPGWAEARAPACEEHRVLSESDAIADASEPPFADLKLTDPPSAGDLAEARVVVVAGAGAGDRDGVARIAAAAERMGAAFGVTRPVAMNAWAPMERLIGVSGARVAPALAIVAGASGAPAFLWGIERAGVIVAVNSDEHAAIVGEADAVAVGDGVAVVEALAGLVAPPPDHG
ncbi:MAG: FAD-binding protein [Thermoleophilia bacterium]|nr:FAD-binding protein [Thermoleophilia bacterium]